MLEFIILGFILCGLKNGYDVKQWMSKTTSYFYDASYGSIYPALQRLTDKKWVTYQEVVESSKYKKLYQITDEGKEAFKKWIEEPIVFKQANHEHLVKVFFYEFLPKEKAIANLKQLVGQIEPVAEKLTEEKNTAVEHFDKYDFYYRYSTMLYGIDFYNFVIQWCNDLIGKLESDPQTSKCIKLL